MNSQIIFIIKILLVSLILSCLIKYIGVFLAVNSLRNLTIYSLISIMLPSIIVAIILGWRFTIKDL